MFFFKKFVAVLSGQKKKQKGGGWLKALVDCPLIKNFFAASLREDVNRKCPLFEDSAREGYTPPPHPNTPLSGHLEFSP